MRKTALAWLFFGLCGCEAETSRQGLEIGGAVQLLAESQGELAEQVHRRLAGYGRSALPYLEAALHGTNTTPAGRRNLVIALSRLELAESAPLLAHIAAFDSNLTTAKEAWRTLGRWAYQPGLRGRAARVALRKVDEVRGNSVLLLDSQ